MDSDDEAPPIVKAKRRRKPINKKTKVHLVFNEDARRDFLTGFHKRKLQRKKKAQEELQELLKAEKKRIKLEAKEQYKKLVHSYKPIPELEEQFAKEYDVEGTTVSVLELDTDLLAETNFLIGRNRGQIEDTTVKEEEEEDESDPEEQNEEMPGMSLKDKKPEKKKKEITKKEPEKVLKTKKEIKKDLKKQSTKSVKKSKVFQKLNEIHTLKQKKKSTIKRRDAKKSQSRGKNSKRSKFKKKK
uniref:Nucleolar protein 12 n=3 Tax=Lygus hesperus TaxID=30085 RepID=A0A0A9X614_LYGHE